MSRRLLVLLPYAALAAVLAVAGYWLLFTAFMVYDDEGYVLWSIRTYIAGKGLYEPVFSQYGPFFYLYYRLAHLVLGLAFDNNTGRIVTLVYWVGVSLIAGGLTWRLARSHVAAAAAAMLTFVGLMAMIREPIHPGGLITLVAMAGAAVSALGILRERPMLFAVASGIAGAALALIKINVGAFYLIAAASWMLASSAPRRGLGWGIALACLAVPLALMRALWPTPWITEFALVFACGSLALVPQVLASRRSEHNRRSWLGLIAAGAAVSIVTVAVVALQGTSLAAIWHGVVVAPLSHPTVYSFAAAWLPGSAVLGLAMLAMAVLVQARPLSAGTRLILAAVNVVAVGWFLAGALQAESEGMTRFAFSHGPVLAWLMVLPLAGEPSAPVNRARTWLAWVFVWQTLHAYPVAGSQIAWGTFLWATLAASGFAEAVTVLAGPRRWWRCLGLAVLAAGGVKATWQIARLGHLYYTTSAPLALPGAERLRPPPEIREQLRVIQENLQAHADIVFSLPGMFSLNIWSGKPTPTDANVTHWFSLLSPAEQQSIIDRLEASPRAVVVEHRYLLDFLARDGIRASGPLRDYIDRNFERAFTTGNYEFWVRRGRTIAPLASLTFTASGQFQLIVAPTAGREVASLDKITTGHPAGIINLAPTPAAPWTLAPINLDGSPSGPPALLTGPFPITTYARLVLPLPPTAADVTNQEQLQLSFTLRDPTGTPIATAYPVR